jgi:hypothetical protein
MQLKGVVQFVLSMLMPACLPADGTLKLWDLRKFKTPVQQADDLPCNYATTQVGGHPYPSTQQRQQWCELQQ